MLDRLLQHPLGIIAYCGLSASIGLGLGEITYRYRRWSKDTDDARCMSFKDWQAAQKKQTESDLDWDLKQRWTRAQR